MPSLTETELTNLISNGESETVEFKRRPPRPAELAERICGMANSVEGGRLIFGVEDSTLKIVGIPESEISVAKDVILRAARMCKPPVKFEPRELEVFRLEGQVVIVATVPANNGTLYQAGAGFWIRQGTFTVPLAAQDLIGQLYSRGAIRWELQPVEGATLEDLDRSKFEEYFRQRDTSGTGAIRRNLTNWENILVGMNCAVKRDDGSYCPTHAGLLFFGYEPQLNIVQSAVTCVLYNDNLGVGRYVDRKILRGNLPQLIEGIADWLRRYIPIGAKIEGFERVNLPDYPFEALREACVNAVIHRDYSLAESGVRLFYYSDRIEIHSPGLPPAGITLEQMRQGQTLSRPRNPVMAALLRDLPTYMEGIGSGVRLMIHQMRELGRPAPEFKLVSGVLVVTFWGNPQSHTSAAHDLIPNAAQLSIIERSSNVPTPDPQSLTPNSRPLTSDEQAEERIAQTLRYIHQYGKITNQDYRALTGVSERTALRHLEQLVEQGILRAVGQKRTRYYTLP